MNWTPLALALALLPLARAAEPAPRPDPICGADILTVGDAWENSLVEVEELRRMVERGPLTRWPERTTALVAHLRFIERRMSPKAERLRLGVQIVAERQMLTNRLALAEDRAGLRAELAQIESGLQLVGVQLAPADRTPTTSLAHLRPAAPPVLRVKLTEPPALKPDSPARVLFQLSTEAGAAFSESALATAHEAPLHAWIADETLTDFQHALPTATAAPGEFECTFTPRREGQYRLWVLAVPAATNREELHSLDLGAPRATPAPAATLTAEDGGFRATLRFENTAPRRDEIASARVAFTTGDGQPVRTLEPIFGSFAQVTAIPADRAALLHIHAAAYAPRREMRGGPEIAFRFRPAASGPHRLFVQARIDGRVHTFALGFRAEEKPGS